MRFRVHPHDHGPPHVHAWFSGGEIVIELLPGGTVRLLQGGSRVTAMTRAGVRYVLRPAGEIVEERFELCARMER